MLISEDAKTSIHVLLRQGSLAFEEGVCGVIYK
jgi:hypothetical protein